MSSATARTRRSPLTALLRRAWQDARRCTLAEVRARGFTDLDDPHLLVFQHPGPDGLRPTELARRIRATRQATNYLLLQLESMGYLTRRRDRGQTPRICVTPQGRRLRAAMTTAIRRYEQRCRRRVGAARYRAFVEVLESIARP
jgi:DNA-binding MarR family transcriptional regulator